MRAKLCHNSLVFAISIFCAGGLFANPTDTFRLANKSLSEGALNDAIHLYESLINQGYSSVPLHYNLGTAHAQAEDWVNARLHLERAQHKAPLNEDIERNLDVVRDEIGEYYRFPSYPLDKTIGWFSTRLGHAFLPLCQLLSFTLLLILLYKWRQSPSALLRRLVIGSAGLMLILLPFTVAQQLAEKRTARMVLLVEDYEVKLQPEAAGSVMEALPAGSKLLVQEKFGEWWQVSTATGDIGWIESGVATSLL